MLDLYCTRIMDNTCKMHVTDNGVKELQRALPNCRIGY
jgi:hypothetical protein